LLSLIHVVEWLPRNATGKIIKALREPYRAGQQRRVS